MTHFAASPHARRMLLTSLVVVSAIAAATFLKAELTGSQSTIVASDSTGKIAVYSTTGSIDTTNPFFQDLGTNGRTCATCHTPQNAMSISAADALARFDASNGSDPLFAAVDGTNCPTADVSTVSAHRAASSLLLNKALIRVGMPVPAGAEFTVAVVADPYGCALVGNEVSIYRRPLPSTSVTFLSTVMWDGRENKAGLSIHDDLKSQARDATLGHAQATQSPTDAQLEQIVQFQEHLFTAQSKDDLAGPLDAAGATGGPVNLSSQEFFIGINDPLGLNPTGAAFDPEVFTIFKPWLNLDISADRYNAQREAIARGAELFNSKKINITGVAGLNDVVGAKTIAGTCTTCHDAPNVGHHSVSQPLNIGVTAATALAPLDVSGLPVFKLTRLSNPRQVVYTTDPGRALVSGKWADVGKTKGPILRGLAARAPYFHNGSAATLLDVVNFYDRRFNIGLTDQEKADLVAALQAF